MVKKTKHLNISALFVYLQNIYRCENTHNLLIMNKIEKYNRRRVVSSYFSVTLTLTLILFLLGVLSVMVFGAYRLGDYFKQQITISLFLKNSALKTEVEQLESQLKNENYAYRVVFIPKQEAAKQFAKEIGEDFLSFIGDNPLQNAIDIQLNPDFTSEKQIENIAETLRKKSIISDVVYDKPLAEAMYNNIEKISGIILLITVSLTVISVLLINASIRLSIYSKRFTIKTMQLVGATKSFIRRPFIKVNVILGIVSAFCAMILLSVGLYYINLNFNNLILVSDYKFIVFLFLGILTFGILITWISTFFATQRFLNLHSDKLYH